MCDSIINYITFECKGTTQSPLRALELELADQSEQLLSMEFC